MTLTETRPAWKRLAGNTAIYTVGHMLPQVVNILLLPIFTRYLSPSEYGILGYTTAICSFLTALGHLSIHSFVMSHYNECRSDEDRQTLIGTVLIFLAVYNTLLMSLFFVFIPKLLRGSQVSFDPYVKLALWAMFLEIFGVVPMAWFRIREEAGRFVAFTAGQTILSISLSLYFVVGRQMGVLGRYWGQLGADIIILSICTIVFGRMFKPRFDVALLKKGLLFCLPLAAGGYLDIVSTMSDRFFLERYVPLSVMGIYTFGFSLGYGLTSIIQGIYKAMEPTVFRMATDSTIDTGILAMKRGMVLALGIIGCLAIGFSRDAIMLIAPAKFLESHNIMALTVVRVIIHGITIPIATYLVAAKMTDLLPWICFCDAGTNIFLNLLLVPRFGIYGSAAAGIGAELATLAAYVLLIDRRSSIRWDYLPDMALLSAAFLISALLLKFHLIWMPGELIVRGLMMAALIGALTTIGRWRSACV